MNKKFFSVTILSASVLIVAQYILAFFIFKLPGLRVLQWIGWGIWLLSLYFGIAPIVIFRRKGGVANGKSYVATTCLVDTGLYAIVRHPQYLAGILFSLALMLMAQHWVVISLGFISMVLLYFNIQAADRDGLDKFGDEYRLYMQKVPQVNFILGFIRWLRSGRR